MNKNTYCLLIILVMLCACRSTDYYNIADRYEVISSTKEEEFVRFWPYVSEDSITMKFRVYEVDNELNILLDSVIKLTNEFYMEKTGRCVENNFTFRCVDSRRFFANDLATHPYCIW